MTAPPWLDAASSVSPGRAPVEVNVTLLAFIRLAPFFAKEPLTVTDSPIFSVSRRHPLRCSPCGGPISKPQLVTTPVDALAHGVAA